MPSVLPSFLTSSHLQNAPDIFPIRPFGGQPSLLTHFQPHVVNAKTLVRPSVAARRSNLTRVDQEPPAASIPQSARLRSQRSAIPARLAASAVTTFDIDARNLESIQQEASSEVKGAHSIDRPMSKPILVFSPQEGALYLADLHLGRDSVTAVTSTAVSSLSSIIQRYGGSGQSVPLEGSHTLQVSRSLQWPLTGQRSAKTFNSSTEAPVEWSPLPIQAGEGQRWTALAEVRTFTFYRNILPRSPYLSHSLSFHIFAPNFDWAPAVLKPPSRRVAVRKEVEFSSSGSVPENHQDGIRLAMGDTLSLDARSASPGSPHYLSSAPISLNGVPGKSGMGQPWPIRALSPHLGAVQGGLKQIRSEWDRRQTKRAELAPSTEERSALSFEDDMSTFMLDGGGVPGSDVPSLGQTSGSCSTRDNSDDAWPQWEQGLSSPERPSPERSATGEGSDQPVEPFVLDEDFMTGLNEDAQPLIHLGVSPPEVSKTPLPPKLDARPPNRASRKSTGGKRGRR